MKRLLLAALCSASLSACAQSADGTPATAKAAAGATPAAAPAQEPRYAAGTPEARVREALHALNPQIQVDGIAAAPVK